MRKWEYLIVALCIACMFAGGLNVSAQSSKKPTFVNFMWDLDLPANVSSEELENAKAQIADVGNLMNLNNARWNLFLTQGAMEQTRLLLAQLALDPLLEIGISGSHLDEKLSAKSYSEQLSILEKSMYYAKGVGICDVNEVQARGFLPQSFDQNEDTYKAIDEVGLDYDAGFQAGILYAPGHDEDVWPYRVEGHEFYAVPISTYMLSGELVPLSDRYAKDNGISPSEWKDMLVGKFDEISGEDEPMVISLSSSISGSGEYAEALNEFIDYASSNNAEFVSSSDLVEMSRTGIHELSEELLAAKAAFAAQKAEEAQADTSSDCPECDDKNNGSSLGTEVVLEL
jgi:hypothetical protein